VCVARRESAETSNESGGRRSCEQTSIHHVRSYQEF
jgi:hypothetical protein